MATITFTSLALPVPEPYDSAHPARQRENLLYVLNQMLGQLKDQAVKLDIDLTDAVRELSLTGTEVALPGFKLTRVGRTITLHLTP